MKELFTNQEQNTLLLDAIKVGDREAPVSTEVFLEELPVLGA